MTDLTTDVVDERETDGWAVAALVSGIVGVCLPLTLWLGAKALGRIHRDPVNKKGAGLATAGMVAGSTWALVALIGLAAFSGDAPQKTNAEEFSTGEAHRVAVLVDRLEAGLDDGDATLVCDELFSERLRALLEDNGGCDQLVMGDKGTQQHLKVERISVDGTVAQATITEGDETHVFTFVLVDDEWHVDTAVTQGTFRHGGRVRREPAPAGLVDAVLRAAGLAEPWHVVSVATVGWVNRHTTIRVEGSSELFVVRHYGWPFAEPEVVDRRAKEQWLHPLLAAAGVPVPDVVAVADDAGEQAALLTHVPGELLGTAAVGSNPALLRDAWTQAGAALRAAHDLGPTLLGDAPDGPVHPGGRIEPLDGGVGRWLATEAVAHAERLATEAPALGVDAARIAGLGDAMAQAVDAERRVLGHSDPHAWNVLVADGPGSTWHLSGFLDWEFAWHATPALDHVRMLAHRYADFGPLPDAWWEGYGSPPDEPALAAATLHFMLWKALDPLDGVASRDAEVALAWLADLPAHLDRLDGLL